MGPAASSAVDSGATAIVAEDAALPGIEPAVAPASPETRQGAIFAIASIANSERELDSTLVEIHRIVLGLLPAEHFLIALREPGSNAVRALVAGPPARMENSPG